MDDAPRHPRSDNVSSRATWVLVRDRGRARELAPSARASARRNCTDRSGHTSCECVCAAHSCLPSICTPAAPAPSGEDVFRDSPVLATRDRSASRGSIRPSGTRCRSRLATIRAGARFCLAVCKTTRTTGALGSLSSPSAAANTTPYRPPWRIETPIWAGEGVAEEAALSRPRTPGQPHRVSSGTFLLPCVVQKSDTGELSPRPRRRCQATARRPAPSSPLVLAAAGAHR